MNESRLHSLESNQAGAVAPPARKASPIRGGSLLPKTKTATQRPRVAVLVFSSSQFLR